MVSFRFIGTVYSEHTRAERTPIQPVYAAGCLGRVVVRAEFEAGLQDLEGFSHLYLICLFDRAAGFELTVKPFLEDVEHGVFATRSPLRPNPIGLSIVKLLRREGNILHIENVDLLDRTPVLDIKPYVARFDRIEGTRNGWQDGVDEATARRLGVRGYSPPE